MVTFATYVQMGNTLTASKAFVALALFNILRFPLTAIPWMIMNIIQVGEQFPAGFVTDKIHKKVSTLIGQEEFVRNC